MRCKKKNREDYPDLAYDYYEVEYMTEDDHFRIRGRGKRNYKKQWFDFYSGGKKLNWREAGAVFIEEYGERAKDGR